MKSKLFCSILLLTSFQLLVAQAIPNRWYMLSIAEKPVGYFKESFDQNATGTDYSAKMGITISRLGSETSLESLQHSNENQHGNLLTISSDVLFSKQLNTTRAEIEFDSIKITNETGGKKSFSKLHYDGSLIGYDGTRKLTIQRIKNLNDSIAYKTFLPDFGIVVWVIRKFAGREDIFVNGRIYNALKVTDRLDALHLQRESWLDEDGYLLKSAEPSPFGQMTLLLSDERTVMTLANKKIELAEDQYASTVALSNVRLPQPRRMESVTIKIKRNSPDVALPEFAGSYQQVLEKQKDYVILKIKSPKIGQFKETVSPGFRNDFIASSSFINTEDTLVIQSVNKIIGNENDAWKKAMMIRDWVNRNMKFNPGIGMAPSSEIIRNMEGTCVSFATITVTLCRAAGIPSRYVMGYVYLDGMWGGHAWAEVYIKGSWVPIDAAMPSPDGIADASRFYFARSSVKNGLAECLIGSAQIYSNIEVETIEYTLNGKKIKVEPLLYKTNNKKYVNPGLGIEVARPEKFYFSEMDKFYPESLLLSLENKEAKDTVKLYQDFISPRHDLRKMAEMYLTECKIESALTETIYSGTKAIGAYTPETSLFLIQNGCDVYIFVARGNKSEQVLQKVLSGFTFKKF